MWLNEEKTQCYWPPYKSPEMCTEAVKYRHEPAKQVEILWERLNTKVHMECITFEQAKKKQNSLKRLRERDQSSFPETFHSITENKSGLFHVPTSTYSSVSWKGTKRKHLTESLSSLTLIEKVKQTIKGVDVRIQALKNTDPTMITNCILDAIAKMDNNDKHKNKKTVGIFGQSGEGKSTLLSAIMGQEDLLPFASFGACTAVVSQVEANLSDSKYTAEIELISKEEWEKELQDLFIVLSDDSKDRNDDMMEIAVEKLTALYGEDAHKKTLEELKIMNHDIHAEFDDILSNNSITISKCNASEFANDVACFIQHSESSPGGLYWPLVKSVKIKIPNCRDLLEHAVLIDFPGTGNCNKIRDDLWKSKLRDCSSVWVVSAISRATTDKGPWEMLKQCIEELGPGGECKSINFICTKTDDINPKAYCRSALLPDMVNVEP
nr:nuclear GTPase SLIP-GC-like [Misgurnus anguillicaudatus]